MGDGFGGGSAFPGAGAGFGESPNEAGMILGLAGLLPLLLAGGGGSFIDSVSTLKRLALAGGVASFSISR